jgi:hypothetical protein
MRGTNLQLFSIVGWMTNHPTYYLFDFSRPTKVYSTLIIISFFPSKSIVSEHGFGFNLFGGKH